jgi:hypothetical protein
MHPQKTAGSLRIELCPDLSTRPAAVGPKVVQIVKNCFPILRAEIARLHH